MPTGGAAIMRSGKNLLKLARKEQCLALLTQLKTKFKVSGQFYRIFPNGEVQYLHPKDGVSPEKVNAGRVGVGNPGRRIGQNANPVQVCLAASTRPLFHPNNFVWSARLI
jgi:photosystem I subunit II